jgi:diaminopimelate epimerase
LSEKRVLQVQTMNRLLHLQMYPDGQVGVDMAQPVFEHSAIPFESRGLVPRGEGHFDLWPVEGAELAVLSMGNPHAVMRVSDVDMAPVATLGPRLEEHERFARRVNVGFMQVVSSSEIKLRVFERDAGETPACGTGACAAVVAGIRLGWLGPQVKVHTRGGMLDIAWAGIGHAVQMRGPATTVFEGEIEL